jgi:Tfp pilus assembly protein PilF
VIHRKLADALRGLKRPDAAIGEYRKAVALTPADGAAHNALGEALLARNLFDPEAGTAFRTAIALNPKYSAPYCNLAVTLDKQADSAGSEASRIDLLAQACRLLTEGLNQVPDDPDLRQILTAIAPKLPKSAGCEATTIAAPPG